MYVCLDSPMPVMEKRSNINSHKFSVFDIKQNRPSTGAEPKPSACHAFSMKSTKTTCSQQIKKQVSKLPACESFLGLNHNARQPASWPLGDPQKLINLDIILIIIYIHTYIHTYPGFAHRLNIHRSSTYARHAVSNSSRVPGYLKSVCVYVRWKSVSVCVCVCVCLFVCLVVCLFVY